jgi:hypothetical protein
VQREGGREGGGGRARREGAGPAQGILPRAEHRGPRARRHDHREGRGVRAGAERDALRGPGSAIETANKTIFGNGACIYTQSGKAAREFRHRIKAGMVGINVGVPAPLAYFPFSGWDYSFFGDLHLQGREGVMFYTRQKVTTWRWFKLRRRRYLA